LHAGYACSLPILRHSPKYSSVSFGIKVKMRTIRDSTYLPKKASSGDLIVAQTMQINRKGQSIFLSFLVHPHILLRRSRRYLVLGAYLVPDGSTCVNGGSNECCSKRYAAAELVSNKIDDNARFNGGIMLMPLEVCCEEWFLAFAGS
jgi:hypothetical protein